MVAPKMYRGLSQVPKLETLVLRTRILNFKFSHGVRVVVGERSDCFEAGV